MSTNRDVQIYINAQKYEIRLSPSHRFTIIFFIPCCYYKEFRDLRLLLTHRSCTHTEQCDFVCSVLNKGQNML